MTNAPKNKAGIPICWHFAAYGGCPSNEKWRNAQENMANKTTHWSVRCELSRRGGLRCEKRTPVGEVGGVIWQWITSNNGRNGVSKK